MDIERIYERSVRHFTAIRDDLNRTMHLAAAAKAMKSIEQHEANLKARQTHGAHNILTSVHFCMAASTHYGIKEQSNERT